MHTRVLETSDPRAVVELQPLLPQLTSLINDSFALQDRSCYGTTDIFPKQRLQTPDQLLHELGSDALVALVSEQPGGEVAAVACLRPWDGMLVDMLQTSAKSGETGQRGSVACDWEVKSCATRSDPRYRKQGLISQCLDALLEHFVATRQVEGLCLWVTVLEGVGNAEYWQRRGFVRCGGPDEVPVGTWGATRAFRVGTLRKVVG